jgi:hypothetical protein
VAAVDGVDQLARRVAERLRLARGRREAIPSAQHPPADAPDPPAVPTVSSVLAGLAREGWLCLQNGSGPGGWPASVEHIAIGPGGIFVIDSRTSSGPADVTPGGPHRVAFWDEQARTSLASRAGSVAALLQPQHRTAVRAVTCTTDAPGPERRRHPDSADGSDRVGGQVVGLGQLAAMLRASAAVTPARLSPDDVIAVHGLLGWHLLAPHQPDQLTTRALEAERRDGSWDPAGHVFDSFARRRDFSADASLASPEIGPGIPLGAGQGSPGQARGLSRDGVPRVPPRPVGPSHRAASRHRRLRLLRIIVAIIVVALILLAVPALLHASEHRTGAGLLRLPTVGLIAHQAAAAQIVL